MQQLRLAPPHPETAIAINRLLEDVGRGMKLADVHAQLAIGDELAQLHARVDFLLKEQFGRVSA